MVHWILVPAFGKGIINNVLAEKTFKVLQAIRQSKKGEHVQIFSQMDMMPALEIAFGHADPEKVTQLAVQKRAGISTGHIISQFGDRLQDGDVITIVAADPHAYRVFRDLAWNTIDLGKDILIYKAIFSEDEKPFKWFRRLNGQIWTEKEWLWNIRETILLALPWKLYQKL